MANHAEMPTQGSAIRADFIPGIGYRTSLRHRLLAVCIRLLTPLVTSLECGLANLGFEAEEIERQLRLSDDEGGTR